MLVNFVIHVLRVLLRCSSTEYDILHCRYCGAVATPKVEAWTTAVTVVSNDCEHCGHRDIRVW